MEEALALFFHLYLKQLLKNLSQVEKECFLCTGLHWHPLSEAENKAFSIGNKRNLLEISAYKLLLTSIRIKQLFGQFQRNLHTIIHYLYFFDQQ